MKVASTLKIVMFRPRFLAVLFAAGLALSAAGAAAETVFPTGSQIGLTPPGDLKPSTRFLGFEDAERKVTIGILQVPLAAYDNLERSVFAKNQVGLSDVKRESFPFNSGIGVLISGDSSENGVKMRKWFLAANGLLPLFPNAAFLIRVEVPEAARDVYSDAVIRKALESVSLRPPPLDEQLGTLPFQIKELAGFRVMKVVPADGAILIEGPSEDMIANPYVIISVGRGGPEKPDDRARFARDLLERAPLRDLTVTSAEAMRIDGAPGYEVRATALGIDGKQLAVVQWLRFGGGGFLRVIGAVHKDNWDALFPRFRAVRDGLAPR